MSYIAPIKDMLFDIQHLANIEQGGGTPSGMAIAGVKVLMERMPERKKLLLHFTDGQPDNWEHVVRAVKAARDAGIRVYTIGVGGYGGASALVSHTLTHQYGKDNWEVIGSVPKLPKAVARIIKRLDTLQQR